MGNGDSPYGGGQDSALILRRFREADAAYQSAPDAEKQKYFPGRYAALMRVLGTPPRTRDDIVEVMAVAIDELANDLMNPGPVPEAVTAALTNCLRAIEVGDAEPRIHGGEKRSIEIAAIDSDVPSDLLIDLDAEIAKLDRFRGLLTYLAQCSGGKDVEPVFLALMDSAQSIRNALSTTVGRLMPAAATRRSHAGAQR